MGILSSLFGSKKNEPEMEPKMEPTIKESLANLAVEVIGVSERTALIPLQEDNISIKYAELVNIGLENSANARVLKKQLDNINSYLKIGEEFDDCPIFYIDPKKKYIVTCYNHFIIYVIKSGYSTNASGKFNQIY